MVELVKKTGTVPRGNRTMTPFASPTKRGRPMFNRCFHRSANGRRIRRGQSLVEFALTLPILLLLVLGGMNGLQSAMTHYLVAWATREAANQAALDGGNGAAAQRMAQTILDNGITRADKAKITIGCEGPCRRYQPITVAVEYNDSVWVPLGPWNTITVTRRAVRASERDAADTTTAPADVAQPRPAPLPGTAAVPGAAP